MSDKEKKADEYKCIANNLSTKKFLDFFNPLILSVLLTLTDEYIVVFPDGSKDEYSYNPVHLLHTCCCDCDGCPTRYDDNGNWIPCEDPEIFVKTKPTKNELLSAVFFAILQDVFGSDKSKLDKRSRYLMSLVRRNITDTSYVESRVCDLVKYVTFDYLVMYKELFPNPVLSTKCGQRLERIYMSRHRFLEVLKNLLLDKFHLDIVKIILNY